MKHRDNSGESVEAAKPIQRAPRDLRGNARVRALGVPRDGDRRRERGPAPNTARV